MTPKTKAFTLIELLIVIAIIAILALIAVPNFLEAQTRAKVSRTLGDLNAMSTAMESYHIDEGAYPMSDAGFSTRLLTTPLAYMTSLPQDPFLNGKQTDLGDGYSPYYFYVCGPAGDPPKGGYLALCKDWQTNMLYIEPKESREYDPRYPCPALYQIRSFGPNKFWNYSYPYNPTNGTVSEGDITLFGPGNVGLSVAQ